MPLDTISSVVVRNNSGVEGAPADVPANLFSLGTTALALTMGIQPVITRLEALKDQLRTGANENSYNFDVPGIGTVKIDRPGVASSWLEWEVDETKLAALSEDERTKLVKSGVIARKRKQRAGSKAKLTLDLNA
jgi:hypothetical protein